MQRASSTFHLSSNPLMKCSLLYGTARVRVVAKSGSSTWSVQSETLYRTILKQAAKRWQIYVSLNIGCASSFGSYFHVLGFYPQNRYTNV